MTLFMNKVNNLLRLLLQTLARAFSYKLLDYGLLSRDNTLMQQFQNGLYYKPGSKVLTYLLAQALVPVVIVDVLLVLAIIFIQNSVAVSPTLTSMLPFSPSLITHYGLPIVIVGGVVIALIGGITAWTNYASVRFMFDEFAFHIERGLVSRSAIAIPFKQIQNVSHEQSMNEKMLGIVRVVIETAGTNDVASAKSDGLLPLLDIATAQMLETELLRRSSGK
jgi:membrane protein YdbS with pleckstrin-like domain